MRVIVCRGLNASTPLNASFEMVFAIVAAIATPTTATQTTGRSEKAQEEKYCGFLSREEKTTWM